MSYLLLSDSGVAEAVARRRELGAGAARRRLARSAVPGLAAAGRPPAVGRRRPLREWVRWMARIGGAPAILAALVAAGAALAAPIAAGGAMPEFHTIVVDDAFVDGLWSATCGFAVRQRVEGSIKVSERADEAGRLASRIERYRLSHTLIGPGGKLSWPDRGANTRFVFNPDGTITTTAAGPILRLTAPGAGLVLADLGRHTVTFAVDPDTGEIVDEVVLWKAGPSPDDVDQADLAAVCAALAG